MRQVRNERQRKRRKERETTSKKTMRKYDEKIKSTKINEKKKIMKNSFEFR